MALTIEVDENKKIVFSSGRWSDFLETATKDPVGWDRSRASHGVDQDFTGTRDFKEAVDLATYGWPSERAAFVQTSNEAVNRISKARPAVGYDVAGMYPVVPRYVGGDHECMVTSDPHINAVRQIIPLFVSCSFSAGVPATAIRNRGAAIGGLIDAIEDAGHSVRLNIFEHTSAGGITDIAMVEIKAAGEPLDLDLLAFALCHPSTLRRLHFARQENLGHLFGGDFCSHFSFGYGMPMKGWKEEIMREPRSQVLFFDSLHPGDSKRFETIEKASATVLQEWRETNLDMENEKDAA